MTNVDQKVLDRLNRRARRRILLEARLDKAKQRYKDKRDALKAAHDRVVTRIESLVRKDDELIWKDIDRNRSKLTPKGERSFTTRWVKFQFKKVPESVKLTDENVALAVARKRHHVNQVTTKVVVVDEKKLVAFLEKHPNERLFYEDAIQVTPAHDTLSVKLNEGHDVTFDNKKLSPKAVSVKREES